MLPEFGTLLLCVALGLACSSMLFPLCGALSRNEAMMWLSKPLAGGGFLALLGAFLVLIYSLINNDFTVRFVVNNSNTELPVGYRIAAAWGGDEGSLLLWVLLLSGWTAAVALFSRWIPTGIISRLLGILGSLNTGFLSYLLLTSNPFARTLPDFPLEGRDLNPLLQDPGLVIHPPLLYLGYVGFSVIYAFAITSLWTRKWDTNWARWARPWALAAWVCLTLGIVIGSLWAYYELGWGGWWFWDPVENASLMPWLTGTALLHSLATTEKRDGFKSWTLLLAIITFSLCLLGTFLVRSGVLVSVHTFASAPLRGLFLLVLMTFFIGGALVLYALRAGSLHSNKQYAIWSRESFLLGNNVILVTATLVVLIGTLLPLIHRLLGLGSLSVGQPFFNFMFTLLIMPFALLMGVAPLVRWRQDNPHRLRIRLLIALLVTLAVSFTVPLLFQDTEEPLAVVGIMMSVWVFVLVLMEVRDRATQRQAFWPDLIAIRRSQWGMVFGHLGMAVTVAGIALSQHYSVEKDVRMTPGDKLHLSQFVFILQDVKTMHGPNYVAKMGTLDVWNTARYIGTLHPEKRVYTPRRVATTEAAIDSGFTRDLYAALGESLDKGAWSVRLYYKPFVSWIWAGGVLMALGGVLCLLDPRYRQRRRHEP